MGHHINEKKQFQSDKYPELKPDKIVLSFKDRHARYALLVYAHQVKGAGGDVELAEDILTRLESIKKEL